MPERPKRRKNNKNKRKNKANKPDSSKNTCDLNNTDSSEPCSSQHIDNDVELVENKEVDSITPAENESVPPLPEVQSTPGTSCGELELIEDHNNNSSSLQVLNTALLTVGNVQGSDNIEIAAYLVESPDQPTKSKAKLSNTVKSKSLDNDDDTKIVEITDDCIAPTVDNSALDVVDSNNVIITDVDSDVEWEKTDDINDERPVAQEIATGSLSTIIPLNIAQCGQTKCLTPDEEKSLRNYLKTLNLSTQPENLNSIEIKTEIEQIINREIKQRLRKKGLADDIFTTRHGPPRMLDVIDEEGSSESSMTSRRQSYLSEKKSDVEDLDDDVFEEKIESSKQSKVQQTHTSTQHRTIGRLVPQECVLVGAKIKEPEVSEARGNWTMKTVEKMTGAEIVYLTDTSSSTSSLHEIEDDDDGIETDVSVRMITPTIEVTDTENFLKKSFISDINKDLKNSITETKTCERGNNDTFNIEVKLQEDLNQNSKQSNRNEFKNIERVIETDLVNNSKEIKGIDVGNKTNIERIIKIECGEELERDNKHLKEHSKCDIAGKNERIINIEVEKNHESTEQHVTHTAETNKQNNTHTEFKTVSEPTSYKTNPNQAKDTKRSVNMELDNLPKAKQESIIQNIEDEFLYKNKVTESSHEIIVLSTDDIKTNLYVKDISENENKEKGTNTTEDNKSPLHKLTDKIATKPNEYDLEAKIIKCEFNDAINNLIKEVSSDSETSNENLKETFSRQDSSSSVSSQCTTKYNPDYSSLNDVSNTHDDISENCIPDKDQMSTNTCHVKDVFECVTGSPHSKDQTEDNVNHPLKLRDLCVKRIALLPYGEKILEELASVSQRLQNIANLGSSNTTSETTTTKKLEKNHNMPYFPLPDVSTIEKISLQTKVKDPIPPPVQPRHSSLKKSQEDDHWTGVPTKTDPVYVCLSPSQKMLMEKTHTVITKEDASHLVDMHRKYVDRRGYNETYASQTQKDESDSENPLIVPFKSQTGSRLLALIRDPNLTRNINSVNQRLNHSLDGLQKNYYKETVSKHNNERFNAVRDLSFKPIPPPRPKKMASSIYESDESSDYTDHSLRSIKTERKLFHYSTGNLNKEIENDISSIQNMHRFYTTTRDETSDYECPRRPSLPQDLCEQQMEYIRKKEKEVEAEIQRLESLNNKAHVIQRKGPRAPLISEKETLNERIKDPNNYFMSHKRDFTMSSHGSDSKGHHETGKMSSLFSSSQEEILREKMYSEYVTQMAERQERKQHKIIKITNAPDPCTSKTVSKSMPALDVLDSKVNNRIEKEFISKARERWDKLGIRDPETEDERESAKYVYKEPKVIEHKIKVIEGGEEKDVKKLPSHLQEFVRFTVKDADQGAGSSVVWRPGAPTPPPSGAAARSPGGPPPPPPPPPPVWMPGSAGASPHSPRKTFRPVHFEETPPTRRKFPNSEQNGCTSGSESEGRLRTSHSAPITGLNSLGGAAASSRLPKAQNPTVTLLQKAREGQIPRGASYLQQERDAARLPRDRPSPPRGDPVRALRKEYASEGEADRSDLERGGTRKMADAHRKVEGIGPITKDGMPVALRSEVKDPSRWYKKMYDTIHKNKYDDDYVTIRYKSRRGEPPERASSNKSQYAYFDPRSGYLSEPEGGLSRLGFSTWSDAYDSDVTTGPRRRTASVQEERRISDANSPYLPNNKFSTLASARASHEMYKNQPGRIENYVPGKSSVVDKEAKQQNISSTTSLPQASPKDKKDLTSTILSKSNMARALKESGYESDSTLVFRRRDDSASEGPLSPSERRAAYRDLQAGGEPPLRGFRSPAPPRQETDSAPEPPRRASHGSYSDTESPRRYVESDVNIHYRCPVRHDPLPLVPERELARQQAEHMKRLYREQRRNKYLQELQDMQNRRHQDNFTPSQKTVVPLNRYDEADKVVAAKALYTFNGQTQRELSFKKGDLIHVRRQIDNNWYEGELHGRIGLFPYNYVEIQKGDVIQAPKKPAIVEGRARAKFDFTAQTNLELPLKKGEVVVLTRRIDQNWWEGRNGSKTGIFPDSYVTVLQEPSQSKPEPAAVASGEKPVASPAAHGMLNGSAKRSMGSHSYTPQPNSPALSNAPQPTQPLPGYVARPAQATLSAAERGYGPPAARGVDLNNTEPLYVDTNAEAIPYRAMYKYRPQNPDELELNEGDTVYVLEKCDDGWYVGSSQRTGRFGTFPGNYVERI